MNQCTDGFQNKFFVESTTEDNPPLPVIMKNLVVELYDVYKRPSCLKNAPNVILPGYAKLSQGLLYVPSKIYLPNNTYVKMSVRTSDKSEYCKEGVSQKWFIPNRFCKLDLCNFISVKLCAVLGESGVHTVDELVKKADFNPMVWLPNPPCFIMLCLTDLFGGLWEVEFFVEYKKKLLLHFKVPTGAQFLQVAAWDNDDNIGKRSAIDNFTYSEHNVNNTNNLS